MQNMDKIALQTTSVNAKLEQQQTTLIQINDKLTNITEQVIELQKQNKEKDNKIEEMEIKINSLEQKMLANHIEINNINNTELSASEIIKKIANKTNIALAEHDIADAYKNKKDKIFVEFTTFRKK